MRGLSSFWGLFADRLGGSVLGPEPDPVRSTEVRPGPLRAAAGGVWPPAPLPGVEAIILAQLEFPFDQHAAEPAAYLTIAEAAARVRCCERTVRRAIDTGALRAGVVRRDRGGRGAYRIRPADLDAWLFADDDRA